MGPPGGGSEGLSPVLRLPRSGREIVNWKAAVAAGLLAGATFLLLEMGAAVVLDGAMPWRPVRMMAGIALGDAVVPGRGERAQFDPGVFAAGVMVHTVLSVLYAMTDGALFHHVRRGKWLIGAGTGLAIYLMNFYGFVALFPWFIEGRGWATALVHVVFGVTSGAAHVRFEGEVWARDWARVRVAAR